MNCKAENVIIDPLYTRTSKHTDGAFESLTFSTCELASRGQQCSGHFYSSNYSKISNYRLQLGIHRDSRPSSRCPRILAPSRQQHWRANLVAPSLKMPRKSYTLVDPLESWTEVAIGQASEYKMIGNVRNAASIIIVYPR
jgi:hypothetical protein